MKTLALALGCLLSVTACTVGHRATKPAASPAMPAPAVAIFWRGTIVALDVKARSMTVKRVFARRTFEVAPGCEIIARSKREAALADLRVGDDVEVIYHGGTAGGVATQIAHLGVTESDREAERDRERMQKLLTPSPSERGFN